MSPRSSCSVPSHLYLFIYLFFCLFIASEKVNKFDSECRIFSFPCTFFIYFMCYLKVYYYCQIHIHLGFFCLAHKLIFFIIFFPSLNFLTVKLFYLYKVRQFHVFHKLDWEFSHTFHPTLPLAFILHSRSFLISLIYCYSGIL